MSALRRCPVAGCSSRISIELLLCREHWRSVPRHLRQRAWASFNAAVDELKRRGRGDTTEFLEAREAAAAAAARSSLGDLLEQLGRHEERRAA